MERKSQAVYSRTDTAPEEKRLTDTTSYTIKGTARYAIFEESNLLSQQNDKITQSALLSAGSVQDSQLTMQAYERANLREHSDPKHSQSKYRFIMNTKSSCKDLPDDYSDQ